MQLDGAIRVPSRMRGQAPSVRLSASTNSSAFENEEPARASREAARTLCARFPASRLVCLDFSDVCAQPSRAFACGKARARTYRLRNGICGICGDHEKTHRACAYRSRNVMARSRGRCDSSAFENVREGVVRAPERLRQFERHENARACAPERALCEAARVLCAKRVALVRLGTARFSGSFSRSFAFRGTALVDPAVFACCHTLSGRFAFRGTALAAPAKIPPVRARKSVSVRGGASRAPRQDERTRHLLSLTCEICGSLRAFTG